MYGEYIELLLSADGVCDRADVNGVDVDGDDDVAVGDNNDDGDDDDVSECFDGDDNDCCC